MKRAAVYYNEINPYLIEWLQCLMKNDLIAPGDIDTRSISEVKPSDLIGYKQCHFFAGIGGWSYALRLAGWSDHRTVWTGSCPCQDFSILGKQEGFAGDRDLWPAFFKLIRQRSPDILFGEQVDGAVQWIDRAATDLESIGHAFSAVVIPAVAVGSPHERSRNYFVAYASGAGWSYVTRQSTAKAKSKSNRTVGVVHRKTFERIRRSIESNEGWIVDGLSGEGFATSAYGNAVHSWVAAEFIATVDSILKKKT